MPGRVTESDIRRARKMARAWAHEHGAELYEGLTQQRGLARRYGPSTPLAENALDPLFLSFWSPSLYWHDDGRGAAVVMPTLEEFRAHQRRRQARDNPDKPPDFEAARSTFEGFHAFDMRSWGKFSQEIVVPKRMALAGPCVYVTYRSDKWSDGTHEYIHKITSYPKVQVALAEEDTGRTVAVPARVRNAVTLSLIGGALGFAVETDDGEVEGAFPANTEWYWSPTGKALYAIATKSRLLAVAWGGKLDVEPRGIVG